MQNICEVRSVRKQDIVNSFMAVFHAVTDASALKRTLFCDVGA